MNQSLTKASTMRAGTSISAVTRPRVLVKTRKSSMILGSSKNQGLTARKPSGPKTFESLRRQRKNQVEISDGQDSQISRRDTEIGDMRKISCLSKKPGVTGRKSGERETFESLIRKREDRIKIIAEQDNQITLRDTTIRDMRKENKMIMDEVTRLTKEIADLKCPSSPEQPPRNVFSFFSARRSMSPDDNSGDGDTQESPGIAALLKEWS